MSDSSSTGPERRLQRGFSLAMAAKTLALFASVLLGDQAIHSYPDREPRPDATSALHLEPVDLDEAAFGPLKFVGAWSLSASDPRFGGISSLAYDGEALVALTDSGVVVRFRPPSESGSVRAEFHDLPNGPVSPHYRRYRDSEALLQHGRGWWVAFENRHSLWSYDPTFRWVRSRRSLPSANWHANRGVEAMVEHEGATLLFREVGWELLRVAGEEVRTLPLDNGLGAPTDAVALPNGRILLTMRRFGLFGVRNRLAWLRRSARAYRTVPLAELPLGAFDNVEAIAAQPLEGGATRLWLMTDDDFSWRRTLLVALDLPPTVASSAG